MRRAQRGVDTVDQDSVRLPGLATLGGPEVMTWSTAHIATWPGCFPPLPRGGFVVIADFGDSWRRVA